MYSTLMLFTAYLDNNDIHPVNVKQIQRQVGIESDVPKNNKIINWRYALMCSWYTHHQVFEASRDLKLIFISFDVVY